MVKVADIVKIIEDFAPINMPYIMQDDNNGLLVGNMGQKVTKIMCALDITFGVIDQAISAGADMIVSHHPLIFKPIKAINDYDVLGGKLLKLIKNGIAVYSSHTALDFCKNGINDHVCTLLGLENVVPLDNEGVGRIGELPTALNGQQLKKLVDTQFGDGLTYFVGEDKQFKRIAVMNGGAGDINYVKMAIAAGADCFVSGDFRQHVLVFALDSGISIIDCSHRTSEECYLPTLAKFLSGKTGIEAVCAVSDVLKK